MLRAFPKDKSAVADRHSADIWAFGCVLFQFIAGRPPFRGATDYLTFQKILNAEMEWPEDFDERARDLIELVLVR